MRITLTPTKKSEAELLTNVKNLFESPTYSRAVMQCLQIGYEIQLQRKLFKKTTD